MSPLVQLYVSLSKWVSIFREMQKMTREAAGPGLSSMIPFAVGTEHSPHSGAIPRF